MTEPAARLTLRSLPLPAKLVVTCFLLAVGVGYTAAMVQLHFQDSKSGEPMPTVHDVVLKFTGRKWFETDPPPPVSTFVRLVSAPEEGLPFNKVGTMSPAFFNKCPVFTQTSRTGESNRVKLRGEREGEQAVLVLWATADPGVRERAYRDDHFGTGDKMPTAITKEFKGAGDAIKVKSIIDARCARCHRASDSDDMKAAPYPLTAYAEVEKYLDAPPPVAVPKGGGWVRVQEPMSLDKLTQSTHAHLLSFAVLFALTGLVFAFTSYPTSVRCVLGPWVLVAVVADVSFWWLARLCTDWGPYFAMGVIGTGGAAGLGLAAQITLSLFNLYGPKGKAVLVLLFALGGAAGGLVVINQIKPGLEEKKRKLEASATTKPEAAATNGGNGNGNGNGGTTGPKKNDVVVPPAGVSQFERVLRFPVKGPDGRGIPVAKLEFKAGADGGMVRALFDKESEYKALLKDADAPQADKDKLTAERHGELAALAAWARLPDPARRAAFAADAFAFTPPGPFTPGYLTPDKKVKVKALVTDRCIVCHETEDKATFSGYDSLLPYLTPKPAGKADAIPSAKE